MKRIAQSACVLALVAFAALPIAARAHDVKGSGELKDQRAAAAARPTIDPLVQAILIAAAASVLREAAASPDPVAALGDSIERKLVFALRSPELAQLLDQLIAEAVKQAPQDLREPLAQFAGTMLNNFRRELLDKRQQQRAY
jgi:hypothetical protein